MVLLLLSAHAALAQQTKDFEAYKLDNYLQVLQDNNKFMGSVTLVQNGQTVFNKAFGLSHKQPRQVRADEGTIYRVGSITKMFTATMIMQLVEEDKLSLSQTLDHFYPDVSGADQITIRHLLGHQSGLENFTNRPDYQQWMTEHRSREQMLEMINSLELEFSPGQKTSYSNTNYVLLGYIIEDITGDSYANHLQKRIAEPLELSHTYYDDDIAAADSEAASFSWNGKSWQEAPETDMSIPHGAGAIVSTPEDLTTFIRALFHGELVSQESLEMMRPENQQLGLGMMKFPFHNNTAYGHNGGIDGFQSNVAYFPEQDIAVALTGNAFDYSLNEMLIGILSITFGREFEIPTFREVSLSNTQKAQFPGNYSSDQLAMDIEIFMKNGQLFVQATGQPALPLTASVSLTLKSDKVGLVLEFDSLASGKYAGFTLKQRGVKAQFTRKDQ